MRNLKKFLALVLAMMMTLSLMVTVNASSKFTDADAITDEFSEAVAVLEGLGVFKGYTNGDKFDFRPGNPITRAEVATIVYRLATGDAKGERSHLYEGGAKKFTDVPDDHWASGEIGYCANNLLVRGYDNTRFGPNDYVTGVQAITMILRAVGYGQGGEFEGWGWETRAYGRARAEGMLVNVDDTNYTGKLTDVATRELVAELLFQAALIPQVTWTEALGYNKYATALGVGGQNPSLATENFALNVRGWTEVDEWGNPGYKWYKGSTAIATIEAKPDMEAFTDTKNECDIAHALKIDDQQDFVLYLNGKTPVTKTYRIMATDTVTKVGGQGRLTKVYDTLVHPHTDLLANGEYYQWQSTVTMVDTFLAQVTGVSNAVLDAAGHVITPAKLTLTIYDRNKGANAGNANQVVSKKSTDATNWDYSKGDMVLLNAYTVRGTHTGANVEKAAYETEEVTTNLTQGTNAWVLHVADSKVAKQTTVYWNQQKHQVDGTDTPDQIDLFLDVAGTTTNSDFTWYFDDYKNIIGIGEATKSNYGVITSLYSSFSTADGATDGKAVAKAHVKYSDGSEGDVTIDRFIVNGNETIGDGHNVPHTKMRVGDNSTELLPVYDYSVNSSQAMIAIAAMTGYTKPADVKVTGQLPVAPVASINKSVEDAQNVNATNEADYFGIIEWNLFKFVTAGDGKMTAIEVAGLNSDATPANNNDGAYVGHNNDLTDGATEFKKNAGFLTLDNETVRMDNNTQIILMEDKTLNVYAGLSALPGDVSIADDTEVDWADYDGDGIADVLYTTATVKGTVVYGLFYYIGGAAQWNNTDKKGTLAGYLNGEAKVLTFDNQTEFNAVKDSQTYGGHLFAVQITNDVVTNLMAANNSGDDEQIIKTVNTPVKFANADVVNTTSTVLTYVNNAGGGISFVAGVTGGNSYTGGTTTEALWFHDDNGSGTTASYNAADNSVTLDSTKYYLTGVSKKVGSDLSYLNRPDYTNDITIVYDTDGTTNIIVEIYVTTEPDWTPGTVVGSNLTFGDDITVAPTGLTSGNGSDAKSLHAWLLNFNSGVFCSTDSKAKTNLATPATMLYFPFPVAEAGSYTLKIYDSNGLRYSESGNKAAAGAPDFFSFDFAAATGAWIGTKGLTAGTYTYAVECNSTVVTSGTFTLVLK